MKKSWEKLVHEYVDYRRKLGFDLKTESKQLLNFARFAEDFGADGHITSELCIRWAQASRKQSPRTWNRRIEIVRGFAKYCRRLDERTEVPAAGIFGSVRRRLIPHIFTQDELEILLNAASQLAPQNGLRPATCHAVFGLLGATGLRINEVLQLRKEDVDLVNGLLKIHGAKRHHPRFVPVHPTVIAALQAYSTFRDSKHRKAKSDRFFLLDNGLPANQRGVLFALRGICQHLGWQPRGDYTHHRLHDFRHTFIVHVALRAYERGRDADKQILALSAYVGHVKLADTYWYFTGIPDLMSIVAKKFEDYALGVRNE
jgi:integrase